METRTIEILSKYNLETEIIDISNKDINGLVDLSNFKKLKKYIVLIIKLPE